MRLRLPRPSPITRDGDHLMAQLTGQGAFEVFPESSTAVFWKIVDAQATFTLGKDGRATSLTLHQNGRDLPAPQDPVKRKELCHPGEPRVMRTVDKPGMSGCDGGRAGWRGGFSLLT